MKPTNREMLKLYEGLLLDSGARINGDLIIEDSHMVRLTIRDKYMYAYGERNPLGCLYNHLLGGATFDTSDTDMVEQAARGEYEAFGSSVVDTEEEE